MKVLQDELLKQQYVKMIGEQFTSNFACDLMQLQLGDVLLNQGDELQSLYFLMHGKVKIYSTSPEGKRLIVAFNKPIQLFGDIEFLQQSAILHTIEAIGTVHVLRFTKEEAKRLQQQTYFNEYLLHVISRKFYTKSEVLSFHLLHEASVRFASYLYSITHNEAGEFQRMSFRPKQLQEIAEFIGISTRHLSRIIQQFIDQDVLERAPKGIAIKNVQLLQQKAANNIYELQ